MKNTLFFDDSFTPVLLENEEADAGELQNTIYLKFRTTAAENQKLYITVRNAEYEEELEPSTDYNYQLAGMYWAAGGVTKLQLKNDNLVSVFSQITFPEIISTDAAVLEDSTFSNAFYMQGKEDKDEELRQQVITYANGQQYNITPESILSKIIEIKFASVLANTQALFNATINLAASEIEEAGDITFRIRVNRIFDETFIPIQTVRDGRYIVTISYPIRNVSQNDRNQIDVYMTTSAGNIQIEQGQIRASVTASGLSSSEAFTGDIEWLELLGTVTVPQAYAVIIPIAETSNISVSSNKLPATFTELLGPAILQSGRVTISPITEEPAIGRMVLYYTINTDRAGQYSYNRAYINIQADEFSLNESYPFLSEVDTIDSGSLKLCNVELSTMQLANKTGLSVVAEGEGGSLARLPAGYQEVEYIESTSSGPWIDTGITPDTSTVVKTKFRPLEVTGYVIIGYSAGSDQTDWRLFNFSSANYYDLPGGGGQEGRRIFGGSLYANTDKEYELGNFYIKDLTTGLNVITGEAASYTGSGTITLNNYNNATFARVRWYYVTIYSGENKVADLVPCYRKSDNAVGMFDLVAESFIQNSGSGNFAKGPDVGEQATYKTLISDGTNVYTVSGGTLSASVGLLSNLNAAMFRTYGFENLIDCTSAQADILQLNDFQILRWSSDAGDISSMIATVAAVPTAQSIITPTISLTDFNVTGIELVTTDTSGTPKAAISFDGGSFEYYDTIDEEWKTEGSGTRGFMTVADLEDITEANWAAKLYGVTTMQTKIIIQTVNDTVEQIQYKFLNE